MPNVVIVLFDGFQPLDAVGPHEVFVGANQAMDHLGHPGSRYDVHLAGPGRDPVVSESGLVLRPSRPLDDPIPGEAIDTLLVPGGEATRTMGADHPVVRSVARLAAGAERLAAVCTGTFVLADAGLCAGRRVTTHWAYAGELARRHPEVDVDPDPIYLTDGPLCSSAGVTAGIDLALALVEADCGPSVAQLVARHLVVYLHRPGGQSQFASPVWSEPTDLEPIRRAVDIIHHRPHDDLSVAKMARLVGLSPRHFTRLFRAEIGEPPARYVERIRVEVARTVLENESVGLDEVARRCGFASAEVLRRAFHRRLGLSPAAYRRQSALTG